MPPAPILTFKAGKCELDTSSKPFKVKADPTPGYLYLYIEDELPHFCWRPRDQPPNDETLDLIMFPGDGSFKPYQGKDGSEGPAPSNARIYVLRFTSSSSRHLFWLQSKSQHTQGDPSWFSPRDLKLGQIVDQILQGEDVDISREIADLPSGGSGDDDTQMEDADDAGGAGDAGTGATGGDFRMEGEGAREGAADGGRALPEEAQLAVQNFLRSINSQDRDPPFTSLQELLTPNSTLLAVEHLSPSQLDNLLTLLPPRTLVLSQEQDDNLGEPDSNTASAALQALSIPQKKEILARVLRSPQFSQSLASLTTALQSGGLPNISAALQIDELPNGGLMSGVGIPMEGHEAVRVFVAGVRRKVEKESQHQEEGEGKAGDGMQTD